ncbi:MAG: lamin tail domain-containing protein [Patescibacteria group bacterium]
MYKTALARQRRNKRIFKKILKYFVSKKFEEVSYKFAAVLLLVVMNAVMFYIPITNAFYSDSEISVGNIFQASALDMNIYPDNFSETMLPGNATTTTIALSKFNLDDLDFKYFVISTTTSSDNSACDNITISASSSPQNISSSLSNFVSATSTPVGQVLWDFTFSVADGAPTGTCNFKIIYTAWQTNFEESSSGFNDIDEMTGSITIGQVAPVVPDVVLNEFLPNPEGSGTDGNPMPDGEWVELYNNTDSPIDLSGYYLTDVDNTHRIDIESCRTNTGGTTILGHGFLVVYRYVDSSCNSHNFSLNNDGDTVKLFNAGASIVDSYTYTTDAPDNKSYARIPDGTGGWVDPIPTPGGPNKIEEVLAPSPSQGEGGGEVVVTAQMAGNEPLVAENATTTSEIATTTTEISTTTAEIITETASSTPEIVIETEILIEPAKESEPVVLLEPPPITPTE